MSKRQILEYLLETNTSVSVTQMCVSLLVALVMGLFIYFVYRATYRGTLYSKNFNLTLILIVLITTVVMMIIGTNLALSLGMVGSLSIIRFRTAIKEPRDIAFLFWAVSIGLACGSEFYVAGVLGSVFIAVVLALANLALYDSVSFLLVVRGQEGALDLDGVQKAIREKTRTARLRMRSRSAGSDEVTFELRLKSKYEHDLVEAVGACAGVQNVNLVSYSGESIGWRPPYTRGFWRCCCPWPCWRPWGRRWPCIWPKPPVPTATRGAPSSSTRSAPRT